jgi:hypothetical protein
MNRRISNKEFRMSKEGAALHSAFAGFSLHEPRNIQKKQLLAASYTLKGGLPDRVCQLGRESPGAILAKSGQFCRTMPTISPAPFR